MTSWIKTNNKAPKVMPDHQGYPLVFFTVWVQISYTHNQNEIKRINNFDFPN